VGIFDFLKKRKVENTSTSYRESGGVDRLLEFLGIDDSGNKSELSQATYFACLKTLSETVGKLPLKLMQRTDKGGVCPARWHELYDILRYRPNPYMTATSFWGSVEYNRNHYGNAYVAINGFGRNTTLWILKSQNMEIVVDDLKLLSEQENVYYRYSENGEQILFASEDILHFKSSDSFEGLEGRSVRKRLAETVLSGTKSQKVLNTMYDSGFTKKMAIEYTSDLNEENETKFLSGIERYIRGGVDNIKNFFPVPFGSKVTPIDLNMADAQFLELRMYTALQIASAFGIKPYQIGDYTKTSYASEEAQQLSFYKDTMLYILKQYEEELTYKLLTVKERTEDGLYFNFNVSAILRTDFKTQIESLSKAVSSFIYTPNEAREHLDLPKVDCGDMVIGNGAYIPLEMAGKQYED
jgi:HK97 family phage portal protein